MTTLHRLYTTVGLGLAVVLLSACSTASAPTSPAPTSAPTAVPAEPATPAAAAPTTAPPRPTDTAVTSAAAKPTVAAAQPQVAAPKPTAVQQAQAPVQQAQAPVQQSTIVTPVASPQVDSPVEATETSAIATRFEAELNAGQVDQALALFADGADVKVPPDHYVGPTQIGNWLNYLAGIHFEIEPGFRRVVGSKASWPAEIRSDYLDHIGLPSLDGEASLVVENGRITNYTFYLTEDSALRHRDAVLAASQVEQDPLIVGQDEANVYGFNDVFFDPENNMVSYRDVLTADVGAGPFHDLGGQPIVIHSGY